MNPVERWRLLLGEPATPSLGDLSAQGRRLDTALHWLYGRKGPGADGNPGRGGPGGDGGAGGDGGRDTMGDRTADLSASQLSVPEWINEVHELFPQEGIERLERDAVEIYQIDELVTRADVLERIEPNETLLRAVLQTKHLMNAEVLALARALVAKVVAALLEQFASEIRVQFNGVVDRRRHSHHRNAANLDLARTLRRNLQHYDPDQRRVVVERPYFFARVQRQTERWQLILLVDQSGSMVGSVIHSALLASCLWSVPGLRTHLVVFDTAVVDLSSDVDDPVELLMKVQLGGGTDIAGAVAYGAQLVDAPRRAIVVIISDFVEGGSPAALVAEVAALVSGGSVVLGLAALDANARPAYDRQLAQQLVDVGAEVGAMTPGELAGFVARHVRGGGRS